MLVIEISYKVLYVLNCKKSYGKELLIYGNCMKRTFGPPGLYITKTLVPSITLW